MDENKGVRIGIVIPIYNVAKYLRECLDSVANQSYGNFCAVLVNDGSTDNSKEIALEYVAKDSRFVFIDKENGGQSSARNVGIAWFSNDSSLRWRIADSHEVIQKNQSARSANLCKSFCYFLLLQKVESPLPLNPNLPARQTQNLTLYHNAESTPNPPKIDYIIFLDSDDFWESDLLEKCVDSARITHESNANPDIIWFDWNEIYEVSGKIQGRTTMELFGFTAQTQISAMQWLIQAQKKRVISFWFSVMGLIRFDYLRRVNLRFLEGVIFEDNLFGVLLFSQCESIAIVPHKLYNYRIRGGSTTNNTKSLPPFVAPLRAHFSAESEAWDYFCAYSLCEMSLVFADFCVNLSDKNRAKRCESAFLPNFLAESCDILAFGSDPLNAKSRFIALLRERGKYSPYLKIIAHIIPKRLKRLRFALFLFYFAPKVAFFRTTRKILKTLRICRG